MGPKMGTRKEKIGPQDLKEKRDSSSRRSLLEILQKGAGISSAPLSGPVATSKPAVEISAKGRDKTNGEKPARCKTKNPSLGSQ
jgi:hypothetical protein